MSESSPTELRQAALLARALDGGPAAEWDKIDADAREAVFALRPELAPPARNGLLDEAMAELLDGPLAEAPTPEEQAEARRLADALAQDDAALDADLRDAVYALAPDRAPSPDVSIDDILDTVSTGPFAPVIMITGEFPAEIAPPTKLRDPVSAPPDSAQVVSLDDRRRSASARPPSAPARRLRRWLPAIGALSAAAATLLFVVPSLSLQQSGSEPPLASAPVASPVGSAAADVDEDFEGEFAVGFNAEDEPAAALDDTLMGEPSPKAADKSGDRTRRPRRAPSRASAPPAPRSTRPAAPSPTVERAPAAPAPAAPVASAAPNDSSLDDFGAAEAEPAIEYNLGTEGNAAPDNAALPTARLDEGASAPAAKTTSTRRGRRSADATTGSAGTSRNVGLLAPDLYEAHPELHEVWSRIHQAATRGDHRGAAQQLMALASAASDPDVVAEAAIRAGRHALVIGDLPRAQEAMRRSHSVNPRRNLLIVAREDLRRQIDTVSEL